MGLSFDAAQRSALYQPDGETRRREFMVFVHRVEDLHLAIDILVFCAKPRTWTELVRHGRDCGADHVRTLAVLDFLIGQGFFTKDDGRHEAIPQAFDELARRIERNGVPSPPRPVVDPYPAARREAIEKVNTALAASGYRDRASRRLRVVK